MNFKRQYPSILLVLFILVGLAVPASGGGKMSLGKNPGKTKGRWLEIQDVDKLNAMKSVALGEITSKIQWAKEGKKTPIDEEMLNDKIRQYLLKDLRASGLFDTVRDSPEGSGVLRLDCDLSVEPGSRAARYIVGVGAGKSKSIFEIHLRDNDTGQDLGLYHGYGVGTGMGFKLGGGGARKMTEDDVQENSKKFVELLQEAR